MITTYIRSSLLNGYQYCAQKSFIEYNLGLSDITNQKAEQGTITHKVLEILALCKKALQDGKTSIEDDKIGLITFDEKDLYKKTKLSDSFIEGINKHRGYKSKYTWDCKLPMGYERIGYDFVQDILKQVYKFYSEKSIHHWTKGKYYDCENWTWIPLEMNDGLYDPRLQNIYMPEQHFDMEIKEDWAHYDFELYGEKHSGYLRLKGTIDLIAQLAGLLEVIDYKTGQRKNWATGKRKDYDYLMQDEQLMFYYYALSKLIPDQEILMTIYFIRDGGPFSLPFEKSTIDKMYNLLQKRFRQMIDDELPKLCHPKQRDIKCTWCNFYKTKFDGDKMNKCNQIHQSLKTIGMKETIEKYKNPEFNIGTYQSPGE